MGKELLKSTILTAIIGIIILLIIIFGFVFEKEHYIIYDKNGNEVDRIDFECYTNGSYKNNQESCLILFVSKEEFKHGFLDENCGSPFAYEEEIMKIKYKDVDYFYECENYIVEVLKD